MSFPTPGDFQRKILNISLNGKIGATYFMVKKNPQIAII